MSIFGISKRQREDELLQALHERDYWRAEALGVPRGGVNDGWPPEVRLQKGSPTSKSGRVRIAPTRPAPGHEAGWENETRIYVPQPSTTQGMDDEEVDAVEQEVRDELAAEPPVEPMSSLQVAIRRAGGWLSTDGHREEEAFRLATKQEARRP